MSQPDQVGVASCSAPIHGYRAYDRHGCRCPRIVERRREFSRARAHRLPRGRGQRGRPRRNHDSDTVLVERAIGGTAVPTVVDDTRAAVATLTGIGMSALQIAHRLGVTARTVHRHRAALREEATAA